MEDHPRSPAPDFYSILGISKAASIRDICKAYKSLVMRWHPDKNPSNKPEAEAKFKAINEAYKALNGKKQDERNMICDNPTTPRGSYIHRSVDDSFFSRSSFLSKSASRRSHTPTPGPSLSESTSRGSTTPTDFQATLSKSTSRRSTTPTDVLPSLSRSSSRRSNTAPIVFSQSTARRKPQPIEKKLECSLEDLCHGCVKKINVMRDVITDTGIIVQEEETLRIKVKPGWKKGTKITFEGKGNERRGTLPADIIFSIDEKRHPLFKREGDDLEIGVEIPLVKALTGCTLDVPLLGGEKMTLSIEDIIHPGYEKVISGQGMPKSKEQGKRGDLRISFFINFPDKINDDQRSEICNILQDCY